MKSFKHSRYDQKGVGLMMKTTTRCAPSIHTVPLCKQTVVISSKTMSMSQSVASASVGSFYSSVLRRTGLAAIMNV